MDDKASEKNYVALEKSYIELVTSKGYAGDVCKNLRGREIACQFCYWPHVDVKEFEEHITKYHGALLAPYLDMDPEYARMRSKYWCFLCKKIITTNAAEGGKVAHAKKFHWIFDEEVFNYLTRRSEEMIVKRMNNCSVKI